ALQYLLQRRGPMLYCLPARRTGRVDAKLACPGASSPAPREARLTTFKDLIRRVKSEVHEVSPEEAREMAGRGALVVDVREAGVPREVPAAPSAEPKSRYSRHLLVPEVGEAGQAKLLASKVLLVGAGGLGSPAGLYLAAAGVGTIGLVDSDVVDLSNLQRQI